MTTQTDAFSALTADEYQMIESSSDSFTCIEDDVPVSPRLLSSASKPGPDPALSSPPLFSPLSSPSTGSTGLKRDWSSIWSDDEEAYKDFELDRKRVKSRSPSPPLNPRLRLPYLWEAFYDLYDCPGIAFADKTQHIPELPDRFRYLLLRPPQFGKTLFLSALYHYYDIHGAKHFSRRFGSLPLVTQSPDLAPRHNQHLCLSFRLSDIKISSGIGDIEISSDIEMLKHRLRDKLRSPLRSFLIQYATELGLSRLASFSLGDDPDVVAKTFKLVKARGYTLFVGVDDYDWPIQPCSFAHASHFSHDGFVSAQEIQSLLDTHFWSPLLAEPGVIDKLFVTGALLVRYLALEHLDPYSVPGLELSCGFTEQEVTTLAQAVLGETPAGISELRRSCGGYIFPSDGGMAETLFHPQQAITWISELSSGRPESGDFSHCLLTNILKLLPERSDVQDTVSITTLIDFLAAGAVEVSQTDAALGFDAGAVRWNALYHAGALTYDPQLPGTLRVANSTALSMVSPLLVLLLPSSNKLGRRYTTS
ncbi:hypothetical protein B0H15DRAFT_180363 [Mycena belliarum]|uniref:AAA-ATPase-like domain-containing protein n=1 Tax=Mycena belliarum TaxID=1033014 RepID=A0AAD6UAM9_9AGAR|nr:hypothetical protein B0H15DRAFT_180363 [Mycena belliae]